MTPRQKQKARNDLWTAIWSGRITPAELCEKCGEPPNKYDKLQGHHDDYSKPLAVRWLCRSCHVRHHLAERAARKPRRKRRAA